MQQICIAKVELSLYQEMTEEHLIYDFSPNIQENAVIYISSGLAIGDIQLPPFESMTISNYTTEQIAFTPFPLEIFKFDAYFNGEYFGRGKWIVGLGSPGAPLMNDVAFTGGVYQSVTEVTHNGVTIFQGTNESKLNQVDSDGEYSGLKFHPDGTIFHNNEKGIYIQNGKKYIAR